MSSLTANQPSVNSACNQTGIVADASLNEGDLVRCWIDKGYCTGVITKTISPLSTDVEVQLDSSGKATLVRSLNCDRIAFVHATPLRGITQGSVVKYKLSREPDCKTGYVKWIGTLHVEGTAERFFHFAALEQKIQFDKSEDECIPLWAHLSFQKHILTLLGLPSTLELYLVERLEVVLLHQPDIRQCTTNILEDSRVVISHENETHYGKVMWIGTFMDTGRNIAILELDEEIADCTDQILSITSSRRNLMQVDVDEVRLHKEVLPSEGNPATQDISPVDRICSRSTCSHSTSLNVQLPTSSMNVGSIITIHAGSLSTHAVVLWSGKIRPTDEGQVALVNTERSADLMANVDEIRSFTQEHLDGLRNTLHLVSSDTQMIVPLDMCVLKDAALQTGDDCAYPSVNSISSNHAVNNESTRPDQVLLCPKSQTSTSDQGYTDPSLSATSSMKNILQVDPNEVGPQKRVPSEPPANSTTASNDKSTRSNEQHPRPAPRSSINSQAESHTSRANIEDPKNEIAKLKMENQQLTDTNRSLEQLKEENRVCAKNMEDLKCENLKLKVENAELKNFSTSTKQDVERLEGSVQQKDQALNQKQKELTDCEYKCREQKTQIETHKRDVERIAQSLQQKDQALNQKIKELSDSEKECQKQKREIENLKQDVKRLVQSLQQKELLRDQERSDHEQERQKQKEEIENLQQNLTISKSELRMMAEDRDMKEAQTNALTNMFEEYERESEKLSKKMVKEALRIKEMGKDRSYQGRNNILAKWVNVSPLNEIIGIDSAVTWNGYTGYVKCIGRDLASEQPDSLLAAVELDDSQCKPLPPNCTTGEYRGSMPLPIPSEKNNIVYCYLDDCQLNARYQTKRDDKLQEMKIPMAHRTVRGFEEVKAVGTQLGQWKGIEGNQNSCYMDVTLFSMFAYSSLHDQWLKKEIPKEEATRAEIMKVLNENIVNPLRRHGIVAAKSVQRFRELLDAIGTVKGLLSVEKDPEEFINLLLSDILRCPPLATLSNGLPCHMLDLVGKKINGTEFPSIQMLLENSFMELQIRFREAPRALILQVPRHSRNEKMYQRIFPNSELDITALVQCYKQPCQICSKMAHVECPDCREDIKPAYFCDECITRKHKTRQHSCQRRLDGVRDGKCELELSAVLCIETSHYVSFNRTVSDKVPWVFFDSMSDRQADINVPEVKYAEDLGEKLLSYKSTLQNMDNERGLTSRLFRDAYICFYQPSNRRKV